MHSSNTVARSARGFAHDKEYKEGRHNFLFLLGAIYSKSSLFKPFYTKRSKTFNRYKNCLLDGFISTLVFVNNNSFCIPSHKNKSTKKRPTHPSYSFPLKPKVKGKKRDNKTSTIVRKRKPRNNFCLLIRKVSQYSLLSEKDYKNSLTQKNSYIFNKKSSIFKRQEIQKIEDIQKIEEIRSLHLSNKFEENPYPFLGTKNKFEENPYPLYPLYPLYPFFLTKVVSLLGFVKSDIDNCNQRFNKQKETNKSFYLDKYHPQTSNPIRPKDRIEKFFNSLSAFTDQKTLYSYFLPLLKHLCDWLILEIGYIIDLQIHQHIRFSNTRFPFLTNKPITSKKSLKTFVQFSKKWVSVRDRSVFSKNQQIANQKIFCFRQIQLSTLQIRFQLLEKRFASHDKQLIYIKKIFTNPGILFAEQTIRGSKICQKHEEINRKQKFEGLEKVLSVDILSNPLFEISFLVKNRIQLSFVSLQNAAKIPYPVGFLGLCDFLLYPLPRDLQSSRFVRPNQSFHFCFIRHINLDLSYYDQNISQDLFLNLKNENQIKDFDLFKSTGFVDQKQKWFKSSESGKEHSLKPHLPGILTKKIYLIITDKQFWYSYSRENPLTLTLFFSPYNGEVLEEKRLSVAPDQFVPTEEISQKEIGETKSLRRQTQNRVGISEKIRGTKIPTCFENWTKDLVYKYCLLLTRNERYAFSSEQQKPKMALGQFFNPGENLTEKLSLPFSGQIIEIEKDRVMVRRAQTVTTSSRGTINVKNGDFVDKNYALLTLFYQKLTTDDIIQGIPKIEQLFEARRTKEGLPFAGNLPDYLDELFSLEMEKQEYNPKQAAQNSFAQIQRILIDKVQDVYISQGVIIPDKHLEIVVRQMTEKVVIVDDGFYDQSFYTGRPWFLPGEFVDLDVADGARSIDHQLIPRRFVPIKEVQPHRLLFKPLPKGVISLFSQTFCSNKPCRSKHFRKPLLYKPILLGVTTASLECESFFSAASFQETTRILSGSAIKSKKDFLHGLKERVILGDYINVGTGAINIDQLMSSLFTPFLGGLTRTNLMKKVETEKARQTHILLAIFAEREIIVDQMFQILAPISYLEETLFQPFQELESTLFQSFQTKSSLFGNLLHQLFQEEVEKHNLNNLFSSKQEQLPRTYEDPLRWTLSGLTPIPLEIILFNEVYFPEKANKKWNKKSLFYYSNNRATFLINSNKVFKMQSFFYQQLCSLLLLTGSEKQKKVIKRNPELFQEKVEKHISNCPELGVIYTIVNPNKFPTYKGYKGYKEFFLLFCIALWKDRFSFKKKKAQKKEEKTVRSIVFPENKGYKEYKKDKGVFLRTTKQAGLRSLLCATSFLRTTKRAYTPEKIPEGVSYPFGVRIPSGVSGVQGIYLKEDVSLVSLASLQGDKKGAEKIKKQVPKKLEQKKQEEKVYRQYFSPFFQKEEEIRFFFSQPKQLLQMVKKTIYSCMEFRRRDDNTLPSIPKSNLFKRKRIDEISGHLSSNSMGVFFPLEEKGVLEQNLCLEKVEKELQQILQQVENVYYEEYRFHLYNLKNKISNLKSGLLFRYNNQSGPFRKPTQNTLFQKGIGVDTKKSFVPFVPTDTKKEKSVFLRTTERAKTPSSCSNNNKVTLLRLKKKSKSVGTKKAIGIKRYRLLCSSKPNSFLRTTNLLVPRTTNLRTSLQAKRYRLLRTNSKVEKTEKQQMQRVENRFYEEYKSKIEDKIINSILFTYNIKSRDFIETKKTIVKQLCLMSYLKVFSKKDKKYSHEIYLKLFPYNNNQFAQITAYIYKQLGLISYLSSELKNDDNYVLPDNFGVDSITGKVYIKNNEIYLKYLIDYFSETKSSVLKSVISFCFIDKYDKKVKAVSKGFYFFFWFSIIYKLMQIKLIRQNPGIYFGISDKLSQERVSIHLSANVSDNWTFVKSLHLGVDKVDITENNRNIRKKGTFKRKRRRLSRFWKDGKPLTSKNINDLEKL